MGCASLTPIPSPVILWGLKNEPTGWLSISACFINDCRSFPLAQKSPWIGFSQLLRYLYQIFRRLTSISCLQVACSLQSGREASCSRMVDVAKCHVSANQELLGEACIKVQEIEIPPFTAPGLRGAGSGEGFAGGHLCQGDTVLCIMEQRPLLWVDLIVSGAGVQWHTACLVTQTLGTNLALWLSGESPFLCPFY